MASPFYNQADQAIYEGGQHFIPQEQYRLNYTPPAIMGQNTNAGIASTGAANPYKWPYPWTQGGGAGDISGTQQRSWSPNQNLGPTNITDYEAEAADVGSTWGGSLARVQDLYSKLPTPGNILKWGIDKYQSSKAEKEEEEARKEEEEARLTTATRRRAIDKMKEKYKDPNYIPPTTGGGGDVIQTPPTNGTTGGGYEPANVGQQTTGRSDPSWEHDPFAQGGRIGYERGRVVNPGGYAGYLDRNIANLEAALKYSDLTPEDRAQVEADLQEALANKGGWEDKALGGDPVPKDAVKFWEGQAQGGRIGYQDGEFVEDINVEGPGFDENIMMASDDVNDRILESLYEEHYDRLKGLGHDDEAIHEIIMGMLEEMSTQAPDSEEQGIASLV